MTRYYAIEVYLWSSSLPARRFAKVNQKNCLDTKHIIRIVLGSAYPMIWIRIEIGPFHFVAISLFWRHVRVATVSMTGGGGCFFFYDISCRHYCNFCCCCVFCLFPCPILLSSNRKNVLIKDSRQESLNNQIVTLLTVRAHVSVIRFFLNLYSLYIIW